jgi:serine/threonine-protein kinase HipA
LVQAREIVKEVARATTLWRDVAREVGARAAEISRMASAFEHIELQQGLAL